jgi:hypothetical protein
MSDAKGSGLEKVTTTIIKALVSDFEVDVAVVVTVDKEGNIWCSGGNRPGMDFVVNGICGAMGKVIKDLNDECLRKLESMGTLTVPGVIRV